MKRRFRILFTACAFLFASTTFAINHDVWTALQAGYVPWALELIAKHRAQITPAYAPPGETLTIIGWLSKYDLIRNEKPITWTTHATFVQMITGGFTMQPEGPGPSHPVSKKQSRREKSARQIEAESMSGPGGTRFDCN